MLSVPSKRGTSRPPATPDSEGRDSTASKAKATTITPTSPVMTASKPLKPRDCRDKIPKAAKAVMIPATKSGMAGNSRWMPIAAPMNSARSVAIAMTSA